MQYKCAITLFQYPPCLIGWLLSEGNAFSYGYANNNNNNS